AGGSTWPLGPNSCVRIRSASTPPAPKKASAVKKYMIPMRLWSVVVSQPTSPLRSPQTRSSRSTYCWPLGRMTVATTPAPGEGGWSPSLLQLLEVGRDRVHLRPGETQVGHAHTGLDVLRVVNPTRKPSARIGDGARRERGAAL